MYIFCAGTKCIYGAPPSLPASKATVVTDVSPIVFMMVFTIANLANLGGGITRIIQIPLCSHHSIPAGPLRFQDSV